MRCGTGARPLPAPVQRAHTHPPPPFPPPSDFDHPAALDLELLAEHLSTLSAGGVIEMPVYSFVTHKRLRETVIIDGARTDVLILDGLFVLCDASVRARCDITVGCLEDLDVCLARRMKRDIVERGRSVASVLQQYLRTVKPGFHAFIEPSMRLADLVVPRAKENEVALEILSMEVSRRVLAKGQRGEEGGRYRPVVKPGASEEE